jgi:hypothetical protein
MGAYACCWVGSLLAASSKNVVDPNVLYLFDPADRIVRRSDDACLPPGVVDDMEEVEEEPFPVVYYQTTANVVRDRLELAGYTVDAARRLFDEAMVFEGKDGDSNRPDPRLLHRELQLPVEKWMAYRGYRNSLRNSADAVHPPAELGDALFRLLETDGVFVNECPDPLVILRLALEMCPEEDSVVYNLTNLIQCDEMDADDDPFGMAASGPEEDNPASANTIVLTEGRTDSWILKESLALLYPHLVMEFSFMEFSEFRAVGGAGALANLIKSFAAAGILNRVIAVFDNDAAASAALMSLRTIRLPPNIVVLQLPELEMLRSYPTLGPTGLAEMDINGMAASIELYLGCDVLRDSDGRLPPIQWTGYESLVRRYQGELISKTEIQANFRQKLERARKDSDFLRTADWSGLKLVLARVLKAFHSVDGTHLSRQLRWFYER